MTSLNEVTLIGRIGKDPVPHIFQDGTTIIGFSLATSEKWKDKASGEFKENTEWHTISVKNPILVEFVTNRLNKGDLIFIEGELCNRKWTKKDGSEGTITEVLLKPYRGKILLLAKHSDTTNPIIEPVAYDKRRAAMNQTKIDSQLLDDDVPF